MMRRPSPLFLLLLILAGWASSSVAVAQDLPMKIRQEGTSDFSTYPITTQSTGNATHLGLFTNVGTLYVQPDETDPTILWASGQNTFRAANGDRVYLVFANAMLDLTTGHATGTWYIVGGTGRFRNLTGTGTFEVQNGPRGSFTSTAEGVVTYRSPVGW